MSASKLFRSVFSRLGIWVSLLAVAVSGPAFGADRPGQYQPAEGEFDEIGRAVLKLLQDKDAAGFARTWAVSSNDWSSLITTNLAGDKAEQLAKYAKGSGRKLQELESAAKAFLDWSAAWRVNFSDTNWQPQVNAPKHGAGRIYYGGRDAEDLSLPYLEKLGIVLKPGAGSAGSTNGEFKLVVCGLEKFPGGWRVSNGIQWFSVPDGVADDKARQGLLILGKIADRKGFTGSDDPSLVKLGEVLIRFVQAGDTNRFEKEALVNVDEVWAMFQKRGQKGPSREEIDREIAKQNREQIGTAMKALQLMTNAGIDLRDAQIQIKEASLERCQSPGNTGTLDDLIGERFKVAFSVKTGAKAGNGTNLSGDYVLGAKTIMKILGGDWKVMSDVHWEHLPPGVVDEKTAANIELENYIAEHDSLPPRSAAPEIEFVTLDGEKKMKLSDLQGRVVILDFWATWCGPCQEPMADLQKLQLAQTNWNGKVVILPLSIDDQMDTVRKHVQKRGWTNTFNVWAGEGGWSAKPARAFRVSGVPTTYVIDQKGKIIWAGHPAGAQFESMVNGLLKD